MSERERERERERNETKRHYETDPCRISCVAALLSFSENGEQTCFCENVKI